MTDDHDSLDGANPDLKTARSPFDARRFARLVQSSTHRRLSARRLLVGGCFALVLGWAIFQAGSYLQDAVGQYVASRPEHQVAFTEIELDPPPPGFIGAGARGILASVRAEAKYAATIPVLATDLESLRVALSRNAWIEDAKSVRSSYRRLVINVVYRKPVAQVIFDDKNQMAVIDRSGVVLPSRHQEIEWAEEGSQSRPAGCAKPLIQIRGFHDAVPNRVGLKCKSTDPNVADDKIVEAAELAEFLANHLAGTTPKGRPTPDFLEIYFHRDPETEITGFFLRDTQANFVFWDSAPGHEASTEPTSPEKWSMLVSYLDAQGALDLHGDQSFLFFSRKGAKVKPFTKKRASHDLRPGRASRK